jgi:hypothetical protein
MVQEVYGYDGNALNWICVNTLHMLHMLTCFKGLYTVSLIEGDGIGPEISQSVKDIFAAAKVRTQNQRVEKSSNDM